jgi:hypothetical protein
MMQQKGCRSIQLTLPDHEKKELQNNFSGLHQTMKHDCAHIEAGWRKKYYMQNLRIYLKILLLSKS